MPAQRRLFFALSLPPTLQTQMIQWRADNFPADTGRPIAAASLHLTLAFLGEVSEQKEAALRSIAGRIDAKGFSLQIDDAGHWPGAGVVWLGTRRAPRPLLQLADILRSHAARNGCYQSTLPFHPHISGDFAGGFWLRIRDRAGAWRGRRKMSSRKMRGRTYFGNRP